MNAITSDPKKFKDGDDLFEITLEKMRRDRIYNVNVQGHIEDSSGLKISFRATAAYGAAESKVSVDGLEIPHSKLKEKASRASVLKGIVEKRASMGTIKEEEEEDSKMSIMRENRLGIIKEERSSMISEEGSGLIQRDSRSAESVSEDEGSLEEEEEESDREDDEEGESEEETPSSQVEGENGEGESEQETPTSQVEGENDQESENDSEYSGGERSNASNPFSTSHQMDGGDEEKEEEKEEEKGYTNPIGITPARFGGADRIMSGRGFLRKDSNPDSEERKSGMFDLPFPSPDPERISQNMLANMNASKSFEMSKGDEEFLFLPDIEAELKKIEEEIEGLIVKAEQKSVENQSAAFVPVEKVFGEIMVDNECKLTESSSSVVFCKAQDSGYLIEKKVYSKKKGKSRKNANIKNVYSSCGRYLVTISGKKYLRLNSIEDKEAATKRVTLKEKIKRVSYLMLSHNAKYLVAVDSLKYSVFDVATGDLLGSREELKTIPLRSSRKVFYGFINSTTLIGADGTGKIYKLDAANIGGEPTMIKELPGFNRFSFDHNEYNCVAELDHELYYIDLKNDADPVVILSDYQKIIKKNVNDGRISVFFIEDGNYYFALFNQVERKFKTLFDFGIDPINPFIYSNESNEIIYVEKRRLTYQIKKQPSAEMRSKIFRIGKKGYSEITFNTDVKFHHPYIFFIFDNNEIWLQKIDDPKIIHRFVFFNSISAIDFIDDVYTQNGGKRPSCSFSCLLTYENVHRLADFTFRLYPRLDANGVPRSPDADVEGIGKKPIYTFVMNRMTKNIPIKSIPEENLISIATIPIGETADYYIMLHYLNRIEFYDSRVQSIVNRLPVVAGKRNIIKFDGQKKAKEGESDDCIFYWQDNGRFIDRLEVPTREGRAKFNLCKVYNSIDKIKMCKKIPYTKDGEPKKALMI